MKKPKYKILLWRIVGKPDRWHVCQIEKLDIFQVHKPISPMFNSKKEAQQFLRELNNKTSAEAA
jgi:hypothetical protein